MIVLWKWFSIWFLGLDCAGSKILLFVLFPISGNVLTGFQTSVRVEIQEPENSFCGIGIWSRLRMDIVV